FFGKPALPKCNLRRKICAKVRSERNDDDICFLSDRASPSASDERKYSYKHAALISQAEAEAISSRKSRLSVEVKSLPLTRRVLRWIMGRFRHIGKRGYRGGAPSSPRGSKVAFKLVGNSASAGRFAIGK